jgi:hypothetical protein
MFFANIYKFYSHHFANIGYYNIINQILFGEILYVEFIDLTIEMIIPNKDFGTFLIKVPVSARDSLCLYLEIIPIESDFPFKKDLFSKKDGVLNLIDDVANILINKPFKTVISNNYYKISDYRHRTSDFPSIKINYKRFHPFALNKRKLKNLIYFINIIRRQYYIVYIFVYKNKIIETRYKVRMVVIFNNYTPLDRL